MMSSPSVWFITGTSTGFGRELSLALLQRGDRVIATARKLSTIEDLKAAGAATLSLDVTSPLPVLEKIAQEAISIYGRVDYLVNNAGYILEGTIEETSPEEIFNQFNTNVFGVLNVTKSFLPHFRSRRSGMIILSGSLAGWMMYPGITLYHATKHCLEGIAKGLSMEVAGFGIKVLITEPGHFPTTLISNRQNNNTTTSKQIDDYASFRQVVDGLLRMVDGNQRGDTKLGALRIIEVATGTGMAAGKPLPLHIALGSDAVEEITRACKDELENLERWKEFSISTDRPEPALKSKM